MSDQHGPPYVHEMGATRRPSFTVETGLPWPQMTRVPMWPPRLWFGTCATLPPPFPVQQEVREIPAAFRRKTDA